MFFPLILLLLCSFFVGYFCSDVFIGFGSNFFFDSIFINFLNYSGIFFEFENSYELLNFEQVGLKTTMLVDKNNQSLLNFVNEEGAHTKKKVMKEYDFVREEELFRKYLVVQFDRNGDTYALCPAD
jgi:hypothetical protein